MTCTIAHMGCWLCRWQLNLLTTMIAPVSMFLSQWEGSREKGNGGRIKRSTANFMNFMEEEGKNWSEFVHRNLGEIGTQVVGWWQS